jgi:ferredoxin-NADP reductase
MTVTRKIRCVVQKIVDHGQRVYSVELIPEKSMPVFQPGQFLHLALDEYDPSGFWPDSRAFSIASSPQFRDLLRISYAVKGQFTRRMERELAEGKKVWIKLPYGEFIVDGERPSVLIAGGTGITPFCGFLEDLRPNQANDIYLFYGARCADLLIFQEMLTKVAQSVSHFFPYYFVEITPNPSSSCNNFYPQTGRLAIEQIWSHLSNPLQTIYYLSGPPLMIQTFSSELRASQVPLDHIRIDAWE